MLTSASSLNLCVCASDYQYMNANVYECSFLLLYFFETKSAFYSLRVHINCRAHIYSLILYRICIQPRIIISFQRNKDQQLSLSFVYPDIHDIQCYLMMKFIEFC